MMRTKFNCVYSEISGCNINFLNSNHEWRQQSVEHRDGNHYNNSPDNIYCACKSCNVSVRGGDLSWEGQVQKFVRKNKKHEMEREIHCFKKS
jgi:GH35 family endo-1,4-beta-xylanase